MYTLLDTITRTTTGQYTCRRTARHHANRKDLAYGAIRYIVLQVAA